MTIDNVRRANVFNNILLVVTWMVSTKAAFVSTVRANHIGKTYHLPSVYDSNPQVATRSFPLFMIGNDVESQDLIKIMDPSIFVILSAIFLGLSIQMFIDTMLKGDQGLSAFLSDGKGYNKSNFNPMKDEKLDRDPLPWLKLPRLDFVDVAGQNNDEEERIIVNKLETLVASMMDDLNCGDKAKAAAKMKELKELMDKYGFEYKEDVELY